MLIIHTTFLNLLKIFVNFWQKILLIFGKKVFNFW